MGKALCHVFNFVYIANVTYIEANNPQEVPLYKAYSISSNENLSESIREDKYKLVLDNQGKSVL